MPRERTRLGVPYVETSKTSPAPAGLLFQGQIRDVRKPLVFGTGSGLYGNHIFSVHPVRPRPLRSENRPQTPSNRAYTENSSFPYSAFSDCVLEGFVERAARLYEQEREGRDGSSALGMYVRRWVGCGSLPIRFVRLMLLGWP